ncbi:MAG: hypothetical protein LQ346_004822 [Caloplaca aetnensis]|nr:MAG: hypothetical protein LQ346_004822 [Caloplaca aetnensis]
MLSAILATSLTSSLAQPLAEPAMGHTLEKRITHYGSATFYEQNGAAGSCGQVHADSDMIIALSPSWQGTGYPPKYCGRKIEITNDGGGDNNNGQGKVVVATVADTCPGCDSNHLGMHSYPSGQLSEMGEEIADEKADYRLKPWGFPGFDWGSFGSSGSIQH